jgi:hypothetical protein
MGGLQVSALYTQGGEVFLDLAETEADDDHFYLARRILRSFRTK